MHRRSLQKIRGHILQQKAPTTTAKQPLSHISRFIHSCPVQHHVDISKTNDDHSNFVSPSQLKSIKEFVASRQKTSITPPLKSASASQPKQQGGLTEVSLSKPLNISNMQTVKTKIHFNDSDVRMTTLPNGLRVASIENPTKMTSVQVVFGMGSRFEKSQERGLSILLNKMSFKPSRHFDTKRLHSLEDMIMYESRCDQEMITYNSTFYRNRMEETMEMMGDCILYPLLEQSEIDQTVQELQFNLSEQYLDPAGSGVLTDMMMEACFGQSVGNEPSLGNPTLYVNEATTTESLKQFHKKYLRPDNCVITGVGVNHEEFLNLVKKYFQFEETTTDPDSDAITIPNLKKTKAQFKSGDLRLQFTDPPQEFSKQNLPSLTSLVVSFEGVSSFDEKNIFALYVLETLLGGGNSFSSGGPGKGLQSLIYMKYLGHHRLYSMAAVNQAFGDTGLFSIIASTDHEHAGELVKAITKLCVSAGGQITDEYVQRAKVQFKSAMLLGLEDTNRWNLAADILFFDRFHSTEYICKNIDKVTKEDILRVWRSLLTNKPPAITVVGDLSQIPTKEQFDTFFEQLKQINV